MQEEIKDKIEDVKEGTARVANKVDEGMQKTMGFFAPITDKISSLVLGFGEIIITIALVFGLAIEVMNGLSVMGEVGFIDGLLQMLQGIISVVMAALILFLLFAIKKNTDKK